MSILNRIQRGLYTRSTGSCTVYSLGNDIELRTYTGTSWFLYVDGQLTNPIANDDQINRAFEKARDSKVSLIAN